jgi:hypothetical protein
MLLSVQWKQGRGTCGVAALLLVVHKHLNNRRCVHNRREYLMAHKSEHEQDEKQNAAKKEKNVEKGHKKEELSDEDIPVESREQAIEEIRAAAQKSGYAKQIQDELRKQKRDK